MKTIQPIAFSLGLALVACGHDEPPKTANDYPSQTSPAAMNPSGTYASGTSNDTSAMPNTATPSNTSMTSNPPAGPTSAGVAHEGPNAGNPMAAESGATEAQGGTMLTDEQILKVTHTADTGEIDQARVALSKTKDAGVRDLAQMMIRDHRQSDNKGTTVGKKAHLTPATSSASELLASDGDSAMRTLKAEEAGAGFDKDYVDTQVREHQQLLDALDQKLIPSAKNADVKSYLTEVRSAVSAHLQHAQDLMKRLQH